MLLSIIVPVYNVEEYIERCIKSLLKSEESLCYEIILVNDGSKDGSGNICDKYSETYDYIKTFHKENGGLSDARNYGLKYATGKYIVFVDSDDYLKQNSLNEIYCFLENSDEDIICFDVEKVENEKVELLRYLPTNKILTGLEFLRLQYKNKSMQIAVWHNIYRRNLLIENNLYFKKGIYHEDEEWTPRVFLQAESVVHLQSSFYKYMIREGSIMKQKDFSKHIQDMSNTLRDFVEQYQEKIESELFCLLKDRLVDRYLSLYAKGNFYKQRKSFILPSALLKKNLYFRKTKIKLYLFLFSKRFFCKISRIYTIKRSD